MPSARAIPLLLLILAAWFQADSRAVAAGLGEPYNDSELESRARARLARDPGLQKLSIRVQVRAGVARLEGEVDSLRQMETAQRAVAQVRGLVELESALVVPAGFDRGSRLSQEVERSLQRFPRLRGSQLKVAVVDGLATVEGSVGTAGERRLVLEAARAVRGIRGVDLRLEVREGVGRDDSTLEREIRGLLADRKRFPIQGRVHVRVRDKTAILDGTVQRVIDRLDAEEVAWFAGGLQRVQNLILVVLRPRVHRPPGEQVEEQENPVDAPLVADPETPASGETETQEHDES